MKRINDIFYSLQGEGSNTGRAAIFIRFAGCNLRCSFCDTEFDSYTEMTDDKVISEIKSLTSHLSPLTSHPSPLTSHLLVVLTGGEPTLQVDEAFVDLLHQHGYEVAMESNGTRPAPRNLDWLTVSPKSLPLSPSEGRGKHPDEIKIVFTTEEEVEQLITTFPLPLEGARGRLYLQPCDTGDPVRNAEIMQRCVEYIKQHPQWRLSLQTHKLIGIK